MYNSQYYTCEQIDQRLLQGYLDDYNSHNNTNLTKDEFLTLLFNTIGRNSTIDNLVTQIGYYECDTAAGTAAKAITVDNYNLFAGGSMKVRFVNKNTANNATLNINNQGAKALYYQGEIASSTNSWDEGEVVEIYYDGTSYYANNVKGGSGSGVYDVSKEHPTSGPNSDGKFTLEYILNPSNVNELIPVNKRYHGMSIQFVSTSDNKYVQYRLTKDEWSILKSDWSFCIDDTAKESEAFSQLLLDAEDKILESRDIHGNKTIYTDLEVKGKIKGESIDEKLDKEEGKSLVDAAYAECLVTGDGSEYVSVTKDAEEKLVEALDKSGRKIFFGDVEIRGILVKNDASAYEVSVKRSGGNFTSLSEALKFAETHSPCIVNVYEGTYDVGAEWTDEDLINAGYSGGAWKTGGFVGTRVPNGCTIRGIGDRNNIIIKAETREVVGHTIDWGEISTINPIGDVVIENVTITGKDMRYAVHDDYDIDRPTRHTYKDCIIKYFGLYDGNIKEAIGMGLTNGSTVNIERCHLSAMFGVHTNNFTLPAYLNVTDSVIDSGVGIVDYTSSVHSFLFFRNTTIQQVNYSKNGLGEQMCDIRFVGCGIQIPILKADFEYIADNIKRFASSLAISKTKPVKRVDVRKVAVMAGSDDISLFYGVTLTDIPQTSGDDIDNDSFGNILVEGVVSTKQMGIEGNASVGDSVGIVNGAFELNPSDASKIIGKVFYVWNNIGFIKI